MDAQLLILSHFHLLRWVGAFVALLIVLIKTYKALKPLPSVGVSTGQLEVLTLITTLITLGLILRQDLPSHRLLPWGF